MVRQHSVINRRNEARLSIDKYTDLIKSMGFEVQHGGTASGNQNLLVKHIQTNQYVLETYSMRYKIGSHFIKESRMLELYSEALESIYKKLLTYAGKSQFAIPLNARKSGNGILFSSNEAVAVEGAELVTKIAGTDFYKAYETKHYTRKKTMEALREKGEEIAFIKDLALT